MAYNIQRVLIYKLSLKGTQMNFPKILTGMALLVGACFFSNCSRTNTVMGPVVHDTDTVYIKMAHIKFKTVLGGTGVTQSALPKKGVLAKSGALAKAANINLNKLVLTFVSSVGDTVRDTLTTSTTPALSATSTAAQTLNKNYSLKPLRSWKLVAKTLDDKDSVIHKDSVTTAQLNPADSLNMNLSMTSRFQMYEVKFLTIPDSIASSVGGTGKQELKVNRLKVMIDSGLASEVVIDTTTSFFTAGATHILSYDYVTPGSHTVKMFVYGPMNFWDTALPLYYASTTINVSAGDDNVTPVTMTWTGPTTGTGKMSVTVGKVGKVTVNSTLPGTVIN